MSEPAGVHLEGEGVLAVTGVLDVFTVGELRERASPLIAPLLASGKPVTVDFSGVSRADTAALSLALYWLRCAARAGATLHYRNLTEQMRAIARSSQIEHYLDGDTSNG